MKKYTIICGMLALLSACQDFDRIPPTADQPTGSTPLDVLDAALGTAVLQVAGGGQSQVYLIDLDEDGLTDGLSLSPDGVPEFLFITPGLNFNIGIDINADGQLDYYLSSGTHGQIVLSTGVNGSGNQAYLVFASDGSFSGFDTTGNGRANDRRLPQSLSDTIEPSLNVGIQSGKYYSTLKIPVTCSDNIGCNHVRYSVRLDGTVIEEGFYVGSEKTIALGDSKTYGVYELDLIAFDNAGNLASLQETYIFPPPGVKIVGLTAIDEGQSAELSVSLSTRPEGNVTVPVTVATTQISLSANSLSFNPSTWNKPQVVQVQAFENDNVLSADPTFDIKFGPLSGGDQDFRGVVSNYELTVIDNDSASLDVPKDGNEVVVSESGGTNQVAVRLASRPAAAVAVIAELGSLTTNEAAIDGIAVSKTIFFSPANWNAFQTITVAGVDDGINQGGVMDTDTLVFRIDQLQTIDPVYKTLIETKTVTIINTDDDGGAGVLFSPSTVQNLDVDDSIEVSVVLLGLPGDDVSIDLSMNANELSSSASTLTFTTFNWNLIQTFTVTGTDGGNDFYEPDKSVWLNWAANSPGDAGYDVLSGSLEYAWSDSDVPGFSDSSGGTIGLNEDGDVASFNFQLATEPTDFVNFTVLSEDVSEATIQPGDESFVVLPGNWTVPTTINIEGQSDNLRDGDITFEIVLNSTQPGGAGEYHGLEHRLTITVGDLDKAVFVSASKVKGKDIGSPAAADDLCNADLNLTVGNVYAALIVDGANRSASSNPNLGNNQIDWVLKPSTEYIGPEGSLGTTESNRLFSFPINSAPSVDPQWAWTGLNADWTPASNNCELWDTNTPSTFGRAGSVEALDTSFISDTDRNCNQQLSIICIEQ